MGVVYVICTSVGRAILKSHLRFHPEIPIDQIICLDLATGAGKSNYDHFADFANIFGLNISYVKSVNDIKTINAIKSIDPKLIVQSGWSEKFCDDLLSIPTFGCIGEHPSPLPLGRGAATVNWAIINSLSNWGDSFFLMNEDFDAGPLIAQKTFIISETDDVKDVYDKVALTSYQMIKEHLADWFHGKIEPIEPQKKETSYNRRRTPEDGLLNNQMDTGSLLRLIRAVTKPYPGAFFKIYGQKIIVWKAKKIASTELPKKLETLDEFVYFGSDGLFLRGRCGDFLKALELESATFPLIKSKGFYEVFIKNKPQFPRPSQ